VSRLSSRPHATLLKFGYPDTVVAEYDHWAVLLRPSQVTLGSLVLVCAEPATAFPDISAGAFAELKRVTNELEAVLASAFSFDRVNYLMLRMVDPHVHFHVLPRYETKRRFAGVEFEDRAWPRPPDLTSGTTLSDDTKNALLADLRERFRKTGVKGSK